MKRPPQPNHALVVTFLTSPCAAAQRGLINDVALAAL